MLLNRRGLAFVGHRVRMPAGLAKWQMPQGGIDADETPRRAALRELKGKIGTDRADILAESRGWFDHDVPDEIADGIMGGQYRGNRQKWLTMRFTGTNTDINLATDRPEFDAWEWVSPEHPSWLHRSCVLSISTYLPSSESFGQNAPARRM